MLVARLKTIFSLLLTGLACLASPAIGNDTFTQHVKPILNEYCSHCHGPDTAEASLRVDLLTSDLTDADNAASWIEIRNAINLGEMPPADEPSLPIESIEEASRWIAANLRAAERQQTSTGGKVVMRRLNRNEYTHSVSDLLSMKFPTGQSPLDVLPPDGTAEGFDKVSSALWLDPSLMEHYFDVARSIAERAIVDGPPEFPTATMRLEFEEMGRGRALGYLLTRLGMAHVNGGLQLVEGRTRSFGMLRYPGRKDNNVAPVNGFYRFTVRAGGAAGENGEVPRIRLRHKHPNDAMEVIMEVDVTAPWDEPDEYSVTVSRDTLGGELSVELINATSLYVGQLPGEDFFRRNRELGEQGDFAATLRLDGRKAAEGWDGERSTPDPTKLDLSRFPRVFLDHLEVEGPLYEQWPPKSHSILLFRGEDAREDIAYAREIFTRFLPKAWRRPVAQQEVEPILGVVRDELNHGKSFREAIRVGLTAALVSPKFLYLAELDAKSSDGGDALGPYELASRLSYFLWSSMPDERLFRAAESGNLLQPTNLLQHVERMLADPKSDRFVEGFARQWLKTDTFLAFTPDKRLYPQYDDALADAFRREPLEFFSELLHNDLSSLNFIDSDFAVVNQRLARHYGLEGVAGDHFRKVNLPPNSRRGGLLAMAGVHQAGSDGIRTKPVSRAVYVREVLFHNPPDPPPPNAGEIEPNIKGERLTVRERLRQHQEIKACAACHRALDPYGLALENFNVIGLWRDKQDGEDFRSSRAPPIDASGRLPNGQQFENFEEFRQQLLSQQERFRRGLAERMLVYALGRPVEPTDDATLTRAVMDMNASGDTLRSLIQSLVTSQAFLNK